MTHGKSADVCEHHLTIVLTVTISDGHAARLSSAHSIKIWVKLIAPMNRFGFDPIEAIDVLRALEAKPNVSWRG